MRRKWLVKYNAKRGRSLYLYNYIEGRCSRCDQEKNINHISGLRNGDYMFLTKGEALLKCNNYELQEKTTTANK